MRNLKRALSLALASVMLMGMMVVGSSAASFPDVDDNDNIEAIDVLETVQVMIGNENGDFEPDKNVTRAEMAVVMAKLLNLDYKYYETTCPFNDVPDWAKGWVGACAANGIVSGRGDGVYDPNATVTAVEAASMMMRALGYFQNPGDYEGGFEAATVRQASRITLFAGINGNARDPMNRNQVAQLALNTLEARMVDFTGSMGIEIPGVGNVGYESKYEFRTGSETKYNAIAEDGGKDSVGNEGQYYIQLGEQLYNGNLKKTGTRNDFGAPSTRWTYKNDEVGVYANGEDYMFEGEVKSEKMYSTVGRNAAENYTWTVYMDGAGKDVSAKSDEDAVLFTRDDVSANNTKALAGTHGGNITYVYLNDTSKTATACIVNIYAAEITKAVDGTITLDDMDKSGLEFKSSAYGVGDVVLYTKSLKGTSSWTVQSVLGEAELIEDVADVVRENSTAGDRVTIGDKNYSYSYRFNGTEKIGKDSAGKDVAFYLDTQGNIIKLGEVNESNDFAYVYAVGQGSNTYNKDTTYGATLILTDGTHLKADLNNDTIKPFTDGVTDQNGNGSDSDEKLAAVETGLKGHIVSYTKESNGSYSLDIKSTHKAAWNADKDDILKEGLTRVYLNDKSSYQKWDSKSKTWGADGAAETLYLNKNSAVLVNEWDADNDKFSDYTGYESIPSVNAKNNVGTGTDTSMIAYVDNSGVVRAMYLIDAEISGSNKDITFVVGQNTNKINKDKDGNEYHVYDVVRNGEVDTIKVKHTASCASGADKTLADLAKDEIAVYFKVKTNSSGFVTEVSNVTPSGVAVNAVSTESGGVYTGVNYNGGEVSFDYKDGKWTVRPGNIKDATVAYYTEEGKLAIDGLHTDRNDQVLVVTDEGVVKAVFVKEIAGTSSEDNKEDEKEPEVITGDTYVKLDTSANTATIYWKNGTTQPIGDAAEKIVGEAIEKSGYEIISITDNKSGGVDFTAKSKTGARERVFNWNTGSDVEAYVGELNGGAAWVAKTTNNKISDIVNVTVKGTYAQVVEAGNITGSPSKGDHVAVNTTIAGNGFKIKDGFVSLTIDSGTPEYIEIGKEKKVEQPNGKKGTGFEMNINSTKSYVKYGDGITPKDSKDIVLTSEFVKVTVTADQVTHNFSVAMTSGSAAALTAAGEGYAKVSTVVTITSTGSNGSGIFAKTSGGTTELDGKTEIVTSTSGGNTVTTKNDTDLVINLKDSTF